MTTPPPMLQHPGEFKELLDLYHQRCPTRTLEVGVGRGGTLWQWLHAAPTGSRIVALDDKHRDHHHYDEWTPPGIELVVITGSSHDPDTILEVAAHRPYDWVFIDADHRDHAVRADFRHYSGMTSPDGVVVLHDIERSDDPTIHVDQLWFELAREYDSQEIHRDGGQGIGIIYAHSLNNERIASNPGFYASEPAR